MNQQRMHTIGVAHLRLADYEAAECALEQAIRLGGNMRSAILIELEAVRLKQRQAEQD